MRGLSSILERREQRRSALERALPVVVEQLKALGALRVILFGSLARGDVSRGSDLDLIAVMPSSLSSHEWMRRVYSEVDRRVACDILAYSEADWQQMLPTSRFLRHVLREGKVVHETTSAR
jgi:predicted nucleotidyltransferase